MAGKPKKKTSENRTTTSDKVKASARDLADDAAEATREGLEEDKAALRTKARKARDAVADEVDETGEAAREAAETFDDDDYRHRAASHLADTLEGTADRLRRHEPGDLRADVEGFARRNPWLFFAGAALTGFALSRLVKATGHGGEDETAGDPTETYRFREDIPGYPDRADRALNGDARR